MQAPIASTQCVPVASALSIHTGSDARCYSPVDMCTSEYLRMRLAHTLTHTHAVNVLIINIVCEILLLDSRQRRYFRHWSELRESCFLLFRRSVFITSTHRHSAASSGFVRIFIVHLCLCSSILPKSQSEVRVNEQT